MAELLFIQLIADYGVGDPAFAEVVQKLRLLSTGVIINQISVPKFSTIATGFWTAQFALVNPVPGMAIYTNTAPRKDSKKARAGNEGEGLVYALLNNGVKVIGVNSGYSFAFIKPQIKALNLVNVANKGSQFRSRDFYPEAVISIVHGEEKFIGQPLDSAKLPDVPENRIAFIDGYGNIKTTVRQSMMKFNSGQPLLITLNNIKRIVFFTDGTFSVREGELAFAPGSSGGKDRFMEIFMRGLSAWKEFEKPEPETEFYYQLID